MDKATDRLHEEIQAEEASHRGHLALSSFLELEREPLQEVGGENPQPSS